MPESLPSPHRPAPRRGRGGQRGNLNALKHGFYSRKFRSLEITDLDSCVANGLDDEITLLRVYIRRLSDLSHKAKTLPQSLEVVRTLSLALTSLTRLMKVRHYISGGSNVMADALKLALSDVTKDLGLTDNNPPSPQ